MILAKQHQPGGWKAATDFYSPACAWPEDCMVQWGSNGIVLSRNSETYETAFFEAFPRNPNTFIRGEGASVEEAELKAFEQLERYLACPEHVFERSGYRNGAGICIHCGLFRSNIFEPLETCSICGKPTFWSMRDGQWFCEKHALERPEERELTYG